MYATVRRYEGIDESRSDEVAKRIGESLMPRLRELPGFGGYYLIEAGEGVLTSVGLFDTAEQAHESTRVAARWIREQKLEAALPNTPKVTAGAVIAHQPKKVGVLTRREREVNDEGFREAEEAAEEAAAEDPQGASEREAGREEAEAQ